MSGECALTLTPEPASAPTPGLPVANDGPDLLGRTIASKFLIEERLGGGAMGQVYRARWIALDKVVALKVMNRELASDPAFVGRFREEARAVSRLEHPNSIRLLDFGAEPDGLLYIAMEYVAGRDLFTVLGDQWPLPARRIVDVLSQVLAALAVAHDMGVLHRDLKPENILVIRGKSDDGVDADIVKVCDFGIAKIVSTEEPAVAAGVGRSRKLTAPGLIVGTPAYMSPEQARGSPVDPRSDLYSMGVILYEMLTGQLPFNADTAIGVALQHVNEPPVPPAKFRPGVDPALEAICLKALAKDPAERQASAREMRAALRAAVGVEASDRSDPSLADTQPPRPRAPSSRLLASATQTPKATVVLADPPRPRTSRGLWAGLAVAIAAAGVLAWRARTDGGSRHATPVAAVAPVVDPAPSPTSPSPAPAPTDPTPAVTITTEAPPPPPTLAPHRPVHSTRPVARRSEAVVADLPAAAAPPTPEPTAPPPAPPPEATVATPAPPPIPTSVAAPPPAFDIATAHLDVGAARNVDGASAANVNKAIAGSARALTRCYLDALPSLNAPAADSATMHVETDENGVITDARVAGPLAGRLGTCFKSAVLGRRIANVDTGSAGADIPLSYRPR